MNNCLDVGKIVNTHGVKGEIKVLPLTDDPKRFDLLKYVYIDEKEKLEKYKIESIRYHKNFVLIKLLEINSMNDAQKLKNKFLKIIRKDAVKLPENSYFICDIIGLKVFDNDNKELGIINDIIQTGSNDVYVIKGHFKKELLVPALKSVVREININEGKMIIDLPEGILEDEI